MGSGVELVRVTLESFNGEECEDEDGVYTGEQSACRKPEGAGLDPEDKRANGLYRLVGESFIYQRTISSPIIKRRYGLCFGDY